MLHKTFFGFLVVLWGTSLEGFRLPWQSIDSASSILSVPQHEERLNRAQRPVLKSNYAPAPSFMLLPIGPFPHWHHSMKLTPYSSGRLSAHFLLDAHDVIDETGEIGVTFFIASQKSKERGSYDFRIDIRQKRPSSKVTIADSNGVVLSGTVPMWLDKTVKTKKPYLPWHDGMWNFYSCVLAYNDDGVMLVLVQHTLEPVHHYTYATEYIKNILNQYARHERLVNRPDGYLDQIEHMRCLPIPYTHVAYAQLRDAGDVWISFAKQVGTIEITPS